MKDMETLGPSDQLGIEKGQRKNTKNLRLVFLSIFFDVFLSSVENYKNMCYLTSQLDLS